MKRKISLDAIVLAVSFVIFCGTLVLLLDDELFGRLLLPKPDFKIPKVANVTRYLEDTRRRISEDIAWLPIRTEDPIFEGDTLFTGNDSEMEIQFFDGVKLNLSSNSLVTVSTESGRATIELQLGTFSSENLSQGTAALRVKTNGKTTEIETAPGTSLNYATNAKGSPALTVINGSAYISIGKQKISLKSNQKVDIKKDGSFSDVKTFNIALQFPEANSQIWIEPQKEIEFKWTPKKPRKNYKIQISKEASFKHITHETLTHSTSTLFKALPPGPLYWRIVTDEGDESPTYSFTLMRVQAPQPRYPQPGQSIEFLTELSEKELQSPRHISAGLSKERDEGVLLSWSSQTPADHYELELATDPQFKNILWKEETRELSTKTPGLNAGVYYWRILSHQEKSNSSPWSTPYAFSVIEKLISDAPIDRSPAEIDLPIIPLPPPHLKNPHLEFEVHNAISIPGTNKFAILLFAIQSTITLADDPFFEWEPVEGASRYRLEVSTEKSFSESKFSIETPSTNAKWEDPTLGNFFWQVRTININGVSGLPSETGTLKVSSKAPESDDVEFQISKDPDDRHIIDLSWKRSLFAKKYEIEISQTPSFKNSITKRTDDNEVQFKVDSTEPYYWRIRSLSESDQPIGRFSEARKVIPDPKIIAERKAEERARKEQEALAAAEAERKEKEAIAAAEAERKKQEAIAIAKAQESDRLRREELERQRHVKEEMQLAHKKEQKNLEANVKNGDTKPTLASKTQIKGFRRFFPEYTKPRTLIMGIGGAYANQSFYQSRDNSSSLLNAFPNGSGQGTSFTSVHFDAEIFPHKYLGMGFEGLMSRTNLQFEGSSSPLQANRIDFGFDVRGRYQFFNGLTLVGTLGVKRLSQYYIFNNNGSYSLQTPSNIIDSLNLSESVYVDYLPFASSIMFRLRFNLTQNFKDFPGTIIFTPMIEMRKWWGPFWAGIKYYNQQRELNIRIQTPSTTSNGRVSENTHMLFLMIGFGF